MRTTCILQGIKNMNKNAHITWLVGEESTPFLEGNPLIDKVLVHGIDSMLTLQNEKYDLLINLDIDPPSTAIANIVNADKKLGYYMDEEDGKTSTYNPEADYLLEIALSDILKKDNKKTYPQQIYDAIKLPYNKEEYVYNLPESGKEFIREFRKKYDIKSTDLVIGLNTGSGDTWPLKKWTIEGFAGLIDRLHNQLNAKIILLGGRYEIERNYELFKRHLMDRHYKIQSQAQTPVIDATGDNSIHEFAHLINLCDVIVTGDTAALHLALVLKKPVVALFGPTSAAEIDLFGRGIKIISKIPCVTCYNRKCDKKPNCMDLITVEEVFNAVKKLAKK